MWFNKEVPKEKPLGLDSQDQVSSAQDTQETASASQMERKEKAMTMAEVRAVSEQRMENVAQSVANFKSGVAEKAKSIWAKVAGFGGKSKEALSAMGAVAIAPDVAAGAAYRNVAMKAKEGYGKAVQGIETGKTKLVAAGEAVADKATEKFNSLEQRAHDALDRHQARKEQARLAKEQKIALAKESTLMKKYAEAKQARDMMEEKMQAILDNLEGIKSTRTINGEPFPELSYE